MTERKTVLVDLDNVVYPFLEMMAAVIASNTEIANSPDELLKLSKSWKVWEDWGIPQGVFDWWWEKAIDEGIMWRQGAAITGAVTSLWRLSDAEWHIHIVTTRLNKFRLHDKAAANTVAWLSDNAVPYRSLTFTDDKSKVIGDAIIDDRVDNLLEHSAPVKLLYPAQHNKDWRDQRIGDTYQGIHILMDDEYLHPWNEVVEILGRGDE